MKHQIFVRAQALLAVVVEALVPSACFNSSASAAADAATTMLSGTKVQWPEAVVFQIVSQRNQVWLPRDGKVMALSDAETSQSRRIPHWAWITFGVIAIYLLVAYGILPRIGKEKAARHPDLVDGARLTHTGNGIPGDPLNIALVGSEADVIAAMSAAGWRNADPLGLRSDERIIVDTVLDKPDPQAPVSNLFLFGRKEDLAFEKPIGHSPRERNHVRFWRSDKTDNGRPVWIGAATRDVRVELSSNTKEITHRISPDVDAERDLLLGELTQANRVTGTRWIDGFQKELTGRNGGGDPWHTDGRLPIAALSISMKPVTTP